MGPPPGEESDSEGECKCAALYASGRGGPCYYCAKEGHFLRNCQRKAAGLPWSAPFIEDKGGRRDEEVEGPTADPAGVGQGLPEGRVGATAAERGTGRSHGERSQGERADQGGTSREGPPKP